MNGKNPIIEIILKEKKITDLLESRGIFPERESNNRLSYLCPIHEGDTDPSFIVFLDGEYQTYKCFGCHSKIDVINLLCDLDRISMKQAVRELLNGLDIKQEDITTSLVEEVIKGKEENTKKMEISMLKLGSFCRNHLDRYKDKEEIDFFLNMYAIIDRVVRKDNIKDLEEIYGKLCSYGIPQRIDISLKRKESKILKGVNAWKI